jgi:hypothetical protein
MAETIDFKRVCEHFEREITALFDDLQSGISAREDSRAFGAMIEKRITEHWETICITLKAEFVQLPGRRTIFDFACRRDTILFGFDVKTKDLDSTRYSDGGVCAIGNLLKFLANDNGVFMIVEFGHTQSTGKHNGRDLEYIRVAPFHLLPENCYRIENLGTGQVRLNYTLNQVWEEIEWNRSITRFYDMFTALAIMHYERVSRDAHKRIKSLQDFKANGYTIFKFSR